MDELSRKFRSIDWKGLQKSARRVQASTASALKDMVMTDLENKTRAATADTSWGASGADMMAIAHGTYRREDYSLIMSIVWQRLASSRRRCVYKALELLKFLIMHGAARCSEEARAALPHLRALTDYIATDEHGRDVGDGVRRRAALICQMLTDESVLEQERAQSRDLRAKLQGGTVSGGDRIGGLSSDDYRFRNNNGTHPQYSNNRPYYSDHPAGGMASTTTTTPSGTATFKGYGDDDDVGNGNQQPYDEEPNGQFSQRVKNANHAGVDDLLGGGDNDESGQTQNNNNTNGKNIGDDDIDSNDFNPDATTKSSANNPPANDLLADLDNMNGNSQPSQTTSSNLPTSQLVLQLAAQQQENGSGMQVAVVNNNNQQQQSGGEVSNGNNMFGAFDNQEVKVSTNMEGAELFTNETTLQQNSQTQSQNTSTNGATTTTSTTTTTTESGPKKVLSRVTDKEKDPFADLLSSGKETGML